ncbi:MAG: pyridoxamine 5'-phosphate oxidase family protein [Deltaproteobacteria bacterium]
MLGELNIEQIERVLHSEVIGRIGCHAGGRTYVVPVTYAYDGTHVYAHSAVGLKVRMMRENPAVCFEVDHMENMANWQSVIARGTFEELHGDDAMRGMQTLVTRLAPLMTSATSTPTHGVPAGGHRADTAGHEAVLFRLKLTEKTGRFEKR